MRSFRSIPLLLKPTLLKTRNRWRRRDERGREFFRNGVLAVLTLVVMCTAYFGGLWVLEQTKTQIDFAYFPASMLLGLILFFLVSLLTLTNCIAAVSALYMSKDLGLLVSSPISTWRFFWGKFLEIMLSSSWMTALFLLPVLAMFATFYEASFTYWIWMLLAMIPYFIIPAAFSVVLATFFAVCIPMKRKRELFLVVAALAFAGLILLGRAVSFGFEDNARIDLVDILKLVSMLSFANREWIPSYWIAAVLGESLEPTGQPRLYFLLLLYGLSVVTMSLAFLSIRLFHFQGFSRQGLGLQGAGVQSKRSQQRARRLLAFLQPAARALVIKEYKTASRDITQSVNLLLLCGLFGLYLYMLSFQNLFQQMFPGDEQRKWKLFLLITNICLESFVITAMGTRLVYPSISRESRAYWVLQTAPLTMRKLLRVKFAFWFTFVFLLTSVFFGVASYLAYSSFTVIAVKTCLNALLCFALVGMGIGFGAHFANFTWEHPSQLTTGFGSLVYMLTGVSLIGLTLILTAWAIWFVGIMPRMEFYSSKAYWLGIVAGALVPVLTITAGVWSLHSGAKALSSGKVQ